MSDIVHSTEVLQGLPASLDVENAQIDPAMHAMLRAHASSLHAVGYLLVLHVPPDTDQPITAYAMPAESDALRAAIDNAEAVG